jgi:SAM-dependent methyltransferase
MLTSEEERYFRDQQALHEGKYLAGRNPRQQSGFGRDEADWKRFRRGVVAPVTKNGSFLDVGCANGLLMESVVPWARESGHRLEPYGLDISEKLAELARRRLPQWSARVFVGNALFWDPPHGFDFVRTELVYVPRTRRREYVERLLEHFVAPGGRLILCSYGSSRPEGARAEMLIDEISEWGIPIAGLYDTRSQEHGFVITRVVAVAQRGAAGPAVADGRGPRLRSEPLR